MSVAGRIINIRPLIPDGRFHVNHILRAAGVSQDKGHMSRVAPELRSQLHFWFVMLGRWPIVGGLMCHGRLLSVGAPFAVMGKD